MTNVRVTYYGNKQNKKVAIFKVKEDDSLELIETKNYVNPIVTSSSKSSPVHNKIFNSTKQIKAGLGDVFASITKIFGFKPCTPCNKRRKYLNHHTPKWLSKFITKIYT